MTECVVHYDHLHFDANAQILPLDLHKLAVLKQAKEARYVLGGDNIHSKQCATVPGQLKESHGAHRMCYKKFTQAISAARKRNVLQDITNVENAKRLRRSGDANQIFGDNCMICDSDKSIKVNGKKQFPHIIQDEIGLLNAAKRKDDQKMLIKTSGGNLFMRRFKVHRKCHTEYNRPEKKTPTSSTNINTTANTESTKFDELEKYVQEQIIGCEKAVSLAYLTELSGKDKNNRQHRYRVKEKLLSKFPELLFFNSVNSESQIVVSRADSPTIEIKKIMNEHKDEVIKFAATALRNDVLQFVESSSDLPWPPRSTDLLCTERRPPQTLLMFYRSLLQADHHATGESVERFVNSLSQDVVHCVSRGKFLTAKHTLLANTLLTMTGQKAIVEIVSRYGSCGSYDTVRLVQTAQAESAQKLMSIERPLPLEPIDDDHKVLTHFWWDNADYKKENENGSIHTTHGIAFVEPSVNAQPVDPLNSSIERSGKKTITAKSFELPVPFVNPNKPPETFKETDMVLPPENCESVAELALFTWSVKRILNANKQCIPRFVGWITHTMSNKDAPKTILTFLPPVHRPITEYGTVCETIRRSITIAKQMNMTYTHITLDVGAAEKYYRVIWNNKTEFRNVIIHLGDFHAFQHFFSNIGKFIRDSGFDDVIFQAEMCSEGSLKSVLKGKAYNKSWLVHECMAEAIDRLLHEMIDISSLNVENQVDMIRPEVLLEYRRKYDDLKNKCMNGEMGVTAQYWAIYHHTVHLLHAMHFAINTNDYELRRKMWAELLKLSFVMNKQNYARFGTFYMTQLANLDKTHPGAREEIESKGVSVCRNNFGIRQSVDGAGEQTFQKNSKTSGGIKEFVQQEGTYEKWVLSRPGQADFVNAVKEQTGLCGSTDNPRKCLQPGQVKKHEKAVQNILGVLKNDFLSPFSSQLDPEKLYNIASGKPASAEVQKCLLGVYTRGTDQMNEFIERLNGIGDKHLFIPIERVKWNGFETENMKVKLQVNGKTEEISVQKDVFGLLAAKGDVDMDDALKFPLAPVSLPLATPDGCMRKTNKSKLYDMLELPRVSSQVASSSDQHHHFIMDLTAKLRTITVPPKTFEALAMKIYDDIAERNKSVYLACDTYRDNSIKSNERNHRAVGKTSEKLIIKSAKVRVPSKFQNFLNNGENKERTFELIEEFLIKNASMLGDREIFFARKDRCIKITRAGIADEFQLKHEEADTKVSFFTVYANSVNRRGANDIITVRSHSGDIDIPVIMLGNKIADIPNVFLDNGTSKDRKVYSISKCALTDEQNRAVIGLHCTTGIDQNSSILRKGKGKCWKVAQRHLNAFSQLGSNFEMSPQLEEQMEKFVLDLYGHIKVNSVNEARSKIFWTYLKKKKKIVSLSLLPPCKSSLDLHIKRANYVAALWRQASNEEISEESADQHGWNPDFSLKWAKAYPDYVYNMLREGIPVEGKEDEGDEDDDDEEEFEDHDAEVFGE